VERTARTCTACKHVNYDSERVSLLHVYLEKANTTVEELLADRMSMDSLSDYTCPCCSVKDDKGKAIKGECSLRASITHPPAALGVVVHPFHQPRRVDGDYVNAKKNDFVPQLSETLNLAALLTLNPAQAAAMGAADAMLYYLAACSNHSGALDGNHHGSGHHIAFTRQGEGAASGWRRANDATCSPVSFDSIKKLQPHVLIYLPVNPTAVAAALAAAPAFVGVPMALPGRPSAPRGGLGSWGTHAAGGCVMEALRLHSPLMAFPLSSLTLQHGHV
jgi:hypothetical protein